MASEVIPVARKAPVLAGVCGTDPFRVMSLFLKDVQRAGFSGVQNFPTVGLIDGTYNVGEDTLEFLAILSPAKITGPTLIDVSEDEPWKSMKG